MGWYQLQQKDLEKLIRFLLPREAICTSLTSFLKHEISHPLFFGDSVILVKNDARNEEIEGAVVLYRRKQVLPVFGSGFEPGETEKGEIRGLVAKNTKGIFSIMGAARDVNVIENFFSGKPLSLDYYMYRSLGKVAAPPTDSLTDLAIRKATRRHARYLFKLQEGYEKEEVLIFPEKFNRVACLAHLKRQLSNQLIYFAEYGGHFVAKAGTNAQGYGFYQLGGIFTQREYRNQGIGSRLIYRLIADILGKGKEITLFVKRENRNARSLYEKLGLVRHDDFRITYYL